MGQGLHTKMMAVAAHELGVPSSACASCRPRPTRCPTPRPPRPRRAPTSTGRRCGGACRAAARAPAPGGGRACLGLDDGRAPVDGARRGPDRRRPHAPLRRGGQAAYLERVSLVRHRLLRHARHPLRPPPAAAAVLLLRLRRRGERGRGQRAHRRAPAPPRRHPPRRRRLAVPTIDRGQIEGGYVQGLGWLTMRGAAVEPDGQLLTTRPVDLQDPRRGRRPRSTSRVEPPGAAPPSPASSTAARRSASPR
jgi:xanthine dehydrogenase large subunit